MWPVFSDELREFVSWYVPTLCLHSGIVSPLEDITGLKANFFFIPVLSQHIILGQYWSNTNQAGYLGPVFLILVQQWPKISRQSFDLCRPAGLLPVFLILIQPWPKNTGQCIDLCWPAGLLPVFLILVQPWPKTAGQCIDLCWPACPLPVFLILVQPWPKTGGHCTDSCWPAWLLSLLLILVQPRPKIGRTMYRSMLTGHYFSGLSGLPTTGWHLESAWPSLENYRGSSWDFRGSHHSHIAK